MEIITNESLIKRNARIGQIAMLAGLAVLIGGMYLSFQSPDQFSLSVAALSLYAGSRRLICRLSTKVR